MSRTGSTLWLAACLTCAACTTRSGPGPSAPSPPAPRASPAPAAITTPLTPPSEPAKIAGETKPPLEDASPPPSPKPDAASVEEAQRLPETARVDPYLMADQPPRCPPEMVLVHDERCIDRWEASLVLVLPRVAAKAWSPFETAKRAPRPLRAVSRPDVVPQGYISGVEAMTACRAAGKRLCTRREWVAACRGPKNTLYPYGNVLRPRVCNDDGRRRHPVAEVSRRLGLPMDRMWYEGMAHPLINQLKGTVDKTGTHKECTNSLGAFDMVGNLHEWIEDPAGTFRGGFFMDTVINGEGCRYETTAHSMKYHDYSTGFRCCKDADEVE